jgi:cobalt-zinc-cadmium efflux system outer membrane protein
MPRVVHAIDPYVAKEPRAINGSPVLAREMPAPGFNRCAVLNSIVAMLLATVGCRTVPTEAVTERSGLASPPPISAGPAEVSRVAFTDDSADTRATPANLEQPEPLPAPVADASASPPLTLSGIENLAFENNPTLSQAAARVAAARGRQVQAGLYPNPVMGYHGTEIGNLGTAGQQGGFISQRFITGGKRRLDQAAAEREEHATHLQFHAQEQRVLTDIHVRFYDVLAAQRRVELTSELALIGDNLVTATEKLKGGGLKTENDLLQAQVRAEEAQILLDNARNELEEAWRRLVVIVGLPGLAHSTLYGELETDDVELSWENSCSMVLAENPELQAAEARASKARILIQRAMKEPVPDVDLFVSVRHIYPTDSDVANVQLGMPIPVFDGNQGNIRAAEADWIAACREVERIELDLQDRLAVAYRRRANARQQARRYREQIVPKAERSLSLVTNGYELGQVEYLTLLAAQQTYVQVTLAYIDALRELRATTAVIQGKTLSDSLARRG